MNEKIRAFYEAVSADDALQSGLTAVVEGVDLEGVPEEEARLALAEAVVAFAAAHGYDLTVEDVLIADGAATEGEVSEDELAAVAGGAKCGCAIIGAAKGCGCFIVGGRNFAGPNGKGGIPFDPNLCVVTGM